ncbi:uncharacterized protein [Onthophagus taurus]|uniref:uncharacterized protein n=1 Tax=Onthophagus taurus TaxID=166361 RepID=UPI000C20F5E6|nr:uncharacterized protein LOC111419638 [Onthophagus taurus]
MSATDIQKKSETLQKQSSPRLPYYQINPSYTLRVVCCVLFIFITEILLAHYVYRLISSEVREEFLLKRDFETDFYKIFHSTATRDEIVKILKEYEALKSSNHTRRKRFINDNNENILNLAENDGVANDGGLDFYSLRRVRQLKGTVKGEDATSSTSATKDGDVWLTSHNRISHADMQTFCLAAKNYCPSPRPGPKGEKGETGYPGIPGPIGPRGERGLPGIKGDQGRPGLDGRDGIPGEPGFDGMPGRNGHDGLPGIDGKPGNSGVNGRNGTDGRPGLPGPQGPPGPPGSKGLSGPRGRPGRSGKDGTPGIPGINAWRYGNDSKLLIPPSIATGNFSTGKPIGPIIVEEGDNITLSCAASGSPRPHVEWRRLDHLPIKSGPWEDASVSGHSLNITFVSRIHMGLYECIADNGVPPQVNQTFLLEVNFKPRISIYNNQIGVSYGVTAVLECEVEGFPEPIRFWERADGKLLEHGDKYKINDTVKQERYKYLMQLNITNVDIYDITTYYCGAKNHLDFLPTKNSLEVYELKPGSKARPMESSAVGPAPPNRTAIEHRCPDPHCDICVNPKVCKETGVSLLDLIEKWDVRPYVGFENYSIPKNRSTDCVLYAIGKPVYHRFTNQTFGSWMKDATQDGDSEKYWSTSEYDSSHLKEFKNKGEFRKDSPSKKHDLHPPFRGNAHVVHNNSFYYAAKNSPNVVKMNLADGNTQSKDVPLLTANTSNYLYSAKHNYMDFSVDDNGLWVIFGVPDSNNTAVMKMNLYNLSIEYIWNISLNHQRVGDMFVVCGVLYAIDSIQDRESKIRFAFDLYKNTLLDVDLKFTNPFRFTSMVGYNHRNKELLTWDKGNQLTYPVRYHEIGYAKEDKLEMADNSESRIYTGFNINPH